MTEKTKTTSYDLIMRAEALTLELIEAEGETNELIEAALSELADDTASKLDGYRYYLDALGARSDRFRTEARRLNAIASRLDQETKNLKRRALEVMEARCELEGWDAGRKIETDLGAVFLSRRQKLHIPDESAFIEAITGTEYESQALKVDVKLNRSEITKALKTSSEAGLGGAVQDLDATLETYSTITFK
tara:strand:+ start:2941 stop:3513 length:573 start_codon:yes stop_codon:yes gene_type:complete